jgi:hypothetical protein
LLAAAGAALLTLSELYEAFRVGASGFWSALFAVRWGIAWAGWVVVPYVWHLGMLLGSPLLRTTKFYDQQHAIAASGAIASALIGYLLLTRDIMPFSKSDPRLFFSVLPLPQLLVCGITYSFWRLYGGKLSVRELLWKRTARRERGALYRRKR